MASTGKKGKKNKGKTLALNDFLATPTSLSWSDQVDEADRYEYNRKPNLPVAPKAARAIDESRIPKNPPYTAYVSNLCFEVNEKDIADAFKHLNIETIRLPREENADRIKGFGYLEFNDKLSFIEALQMYEVVIKGRRVRIDIADSEGDRRRGGVMGGMRNSRERDGSYDPERPSGDWRTGPRSDYLSNDKRGSNWRDYSFRDKDSFRERDVPDRGRSYFEDREMNWRDSERRFGSDRDYRSNYVIRRNFDDRFDNNPEPKTRPKLNLKPRSKPTEEVKEENTPRKELSAKIFGQAKPVDTAAREMQIEERLQRERGLAMNEGDADKSASRTEDNYESRREGDHKESKWSKERDDRNHSSSQDINNGQISDVEDAPSHRENDLDENQDTAEDSEKVDYRKNYENENENDRSEGEGRYGRSNRSESRYNDRNRENSRSYRRDDRDNRRDDRRDYDRRDRGYDSDGKGWDSGGRYRDQDRERDREGDRRHNDRDIDGRRYGEKEPEGKKYSDRDVDSKRYQEREGGRQREQDDHGSHKRNDKRGSASGDRGTRQGRGASEKDRLPPAKDKPKESKKVDDAPRMPKFKEAAAPNYVGTNKYCCLQEDGASE